MSGVMNQSLLSPFSDAKQAPNLLPEYGAASSLNDGEV